MLRDRAASDLTTFLPTTGGEPTFHDRSLFVPVTLHVVLVEALSNDAASIRGRLHPGLITCVSHSQQPMQAQGEQSQSTVLFLQTVVKQH